MPRRTFLATVMFCMIASACVAQPSPGPTAVRQWPEGKVSLPIPDRQWAPEAPQEGWCGESSIQMAALYYGAYLPQAAINAAGEPKSPDLWVEDVGRAMKAVGLRFEQWPSQKSDDRIEEGNRFIAWIRDQIAHGHPVLLGTKILPAEHPKWNVDHLVLAVGYSEKGLVMNTNIEDRQTVVSYGQLLSQNRGYSLLSPEKKYFGFAITGFDDSGQRASVTTEVAKETADAVTLWVTVRSLKPGKSYVLQRDDLHGGVTERAFVAQGEEQVLSETVGAHETAVFRAVQGE